MIYRPISDYALIGDTQSAALISSEGSLDWLCLPRFDSPAMFLRLLDVERGGYCLIQPNGPFTSRRWYEHGSAVLTTRFETNTGVLAVSDFMPVRRRNEPDPQGRGMDADALHRVVRLVRCSGQVDCRIEVKVTPDYARELPKVLRRSDHRALVMGARDNLHIQMPHGSAINPDGTIGVNLRLRDGEEIALVLSWSGPDQDIPDVTFETAVAHEKETIEYWNQWRASLRYEGDHASIVNRSAVTLKLLTYEPTGAIIAAPTTSLPEEAGGKRNWDYRFTWLRDSSLTLAALMNLGNFAEAHDFFHFLHESLPQNAADFRILYRIDGGTDVSESDLPLAGYCGSRPVRIGNGAADQKQFDVYGELMHCMYLYWSHSELFQPHESFERDFWPVVRSIADYVAQHWREPGSGMWEMRGHQHQFTHSIGMCEVALDRALKLARQFRIDCDVANWRQQRSDMRHAIETRGFHPGKNAYVQRFDADALDASVLRLPVMGVIDGKSERFAGTIAALERELMRNGLLYRYSQDETDDGIGGREGTFSACAFWLAEGYVLQGRVEEAERVFAHAVSFANDLGLMSEELNPHTGAQLGNFPQGFTHIALINAACRIAAAKGKASGITQRMLRGDPDGQDLAA